MSGFRAFGATDPGREREHNEDCFICEPACGHFAVIDGVGGYAAGEVAAALARDLIAAQLRRGTGTPGERIRQAIVAANRVIYQQGRSHPGRRGMACVLTVAVVEDGFVTVGHVGDTRLYVIRRDGITKVTRDHSVVGLREDRGELSEWEAMLHPRRNEILRDVGSVWWAPEDEAWVDLYRFPFLPDTALLLCSDGLTDLVPSDVLRQTVLAHAGHPGRSVAALIDLANRAGGYDNITVIVVEGEAFAPGSLPDAPSDGPEGHDAPPVEAGIRKVHTGSLRLPPPVWPAGATLLLVVLFWLFWRVWDAVQHAGP
ncbi:protein phosphatase 2C domain-containing protein [Rhodocaloribacter litoris]|uniref:PP2C family protein-serine/threonine phosphatase n=1 Tax=Rhodocaloribacter litoris TaxID=2558931 RepID=UPI001E4EF8B1|nr:protein phosphatase 2C domain-containing protein [Rhodocaloribacter litoris]QXD14059.1 protein phosphatase 2C domain-containing protein [Rhodocaloribacter litoris]